MKRPRIAPLAPVGIGLVSLVVVACGGSDPEPTAALNTTPVPTATRPAATPTTAQPPATAATAAPAPTTVSTSSYPRSFDWRIEEVDRGVKPSVALTADGTPVIAYMLEDLEGFVKSAIRTGGGWDISTVAEGYFAVRWISPSTPMALGTSPITTTRTRPFGPRRATLRSR